MESLKIITNSFTPAKVDFNYQEIANRLDVVLDKYKGLVFTEETVADCKKTMAELRKGQKSLDDYRKETKKKLTESVTEFENDCKTLYKKFDEVLDPLKEQADFFETNRREEKRELVQNLINDLVLELELNEKYSDKITLDEGYLIASLSMTKIEEGIRELITGLKEKQDQEEADQQVLIKVIGKVNEDDKLNLPSDIYVKWLEHKALSELIATVYEDAARLVKEREMEELRLKQLEIQKAFKEEEARKIEEAKLLEVPEEQDVVVVDYREPIPYTFEKPEIVEFPSVEEKPAELIYKTYEVRATEEDLLCLETFLNNNFEEWEIL